MATKKAEIKELSISEKLDQLVTLQQLDSSIDEIRTLRGELPLEVQDLEDEVEGLTKRLENFQNEVDAKTEQAPDNQTTQEMLCIGCEVVTCDSHIRSRCFVTTPAVSVTLLHCHNVTW